MATDIRKIVNTTDAYNLHSHSQFCDGRDTMEAIAAAAEESGMRYFAFTPHSPIIVDSPCNMSVEQIPEYFGECRRLGEKHAGRMELLTSLEIDWLSDDWGPHIDYFQRLPLDFRLGSVHFVPDRDGVPHDCDGSYARFKPLLDNVYGGDIRYVVEKYFEGVLRMIERGGFELLGHFDKIAGNASEAAPGIEEEGWYEALVDDVVSRVSGTDMVVEINTKALADRGRFYPAERWWRKLIDAGVAVAVDSDAHYASKVTAGRREALEKFAGMKKKL